MSASPGFINRTDEINAITSLLDTIDRHPLADPANVYLPDCVVNLHGPPGIGKSALLQELLVQLRERCAVLLLDLRSRMPQDRLPHEKLRFLQASLHQLEALQPSPHGADLRARLADADDSLAGDLIDEGLAALLAELQLLSERRVIVLMIDSCEHASEALFAWMERFVLLPLVHAPGDQPSRVLCVLASQILLRWRQHNVRRRVVAHLIGPLSRAATRAQAGGDKLGDALFRLTFGHALSNRVALAYLETQGAPPPNSVDWVASHEPELMREVVHRLREHAVTSMLAGEATLLKRWEKWELWQILEAIAILREFDVNSLRVAIETYHESFVGRSQSALLIAIRDLLKTRLVEWNGLLRAYQVAPAMRQIFAHALELEQPQIYARLRRAAIGYYEEQVRTVPGNRNLYLIEYMFQRLRHPEATASDALHLEADLVRTLGTYYANEQRTYLDQENLEALERALQADKELQQALVACHASGDLLVAAVQRFRQPRSAPGGPPTGLQSKYEPPESIPSGGSFG